MTRPSPSPAVSDFWRGAAHCVLIGGLVGASAEITNRVIDYFTGHRTDHRTTNSAVVTSVVLYNVNRRKKTPDGDTEAAKPA